MLFPQGFGQDDLLAVAGDIELPISLHFQMRMLEQAGQLL